MENFQKLKLQLEKQEWPAVYFFKFIVPNDNEKIAKISSLFGEAEINFKTSSTGKYISIGAKEVMLNTDAIIEVYKKASQIKGVISL